MNDQTDWGRLQALQRTCRAGLDLIVQGQASTSLFVLLSGRLSVFRHNVKVSEIKKRGDYIGEIGILLKTPASATTRTETDVVVIEIESANVVRLFSHSPGMAIALARKMADRLAELNSTFSYLLDKSYRPELVKRFQEHQKTKPAHPTSVVLNLDLLKPYMMECKAGTQILTQNLFPTALYILVSGTLDIVKNGKTIAVENEEGYYLGDVAILRNKPSNATVIAKTDAKLIEIKLDKVEGFLHHSPEIALSIAEKLAERTLAINELFLDLQVDAITEMNKKDAAPEEKANQSLDSFDKIEKEIMAILEMSLH